MTTDIRSGIKAAAERHGSDGQGAGGVDGYFDHLLKERPSDFTRLFEKTIPPAKDGDGVDPNGGELTFYITPIQSGRFISTDGAELLSEAEARAAAGLPLLVEAVTIEGQAEPEPEPDVLSIKTGRPVGE